MIRGDYFCAVGQRDCVAVNATVARQDLSAQVELRCAGQCILVALAASRLNISRGQNRLLTCPLAVVRLGNRCGRALPAMADDAAESIERVRNCRMLAEGLLIYIGKTGLVQSQVARGAAIDDA